MSELRVIERQQHEVVTLPSGHAYVALSCVWGKGTGWDSYEERKITDRLPDIEALPATSRHAIEMIKAIRQRYLWIDRYCIDYSQGDLVFDTIQSMGSIQGSAYLKAIATSDADVHAGIPRKHVPSTAFKLRDFQIATQG